MSAIVMIQQAEKKKRLMNVVRGGSQYDEKKAKGTKEQKKTDLSRKLRDTEEDKPKKKGASLTDMIQQAGLEISVKQFWLYSLVSGVLFTFLAKAVGLSTFVVIMVGITSFFGLPRLFLKMKAKKRQKLFMDDMADALESMMRLLKAGMPVSEAIKMVGTEFSGPMGEEMGRIYDQQKIGVPLPEAVLEASKRMPLTEMQMFATAIAIQTQTGSSLSEVLQNLAGVIRARFKLARKVKALSSEAKMSAMIIGALPVIVSGGMYFVNPEYIGLMFTDSTGKFLLGCAVGWMCVGVLVMRQMINFKV
ncbi:MAG TPA: type II secretion system F family protein [Alphaproteobacteria bacterium]|nr:type II secretion system F family protein [Alphaproteobacteria bacterium]